MKKIMLLAIIALHVVTYAQPEKIIDEFVVQNKVPGMFVSVVRGDSVLYQKNVGFADREHEIPLTAATCMELGSVSKVFTAEVIYMLHYEGLINLNDPIHKYLPYVPASWSAITIKHLLTHTSGILNYLSEPRFRAVEYFNNIYEPTAEQFFNTITPDSMVQMFYSLPLEFSPGFTWSYSNTGYYLLGKIGEAVTGRPFFELVKDMVTDPLKMTHTKANEMAAKEMCLAKGYLLNNSLLTNARVLQSNYAFSAGAWATTGQDMIHFMMAIHQRSLPSDKVGFDWRKPPDNGDLPFTYNGGRYYTTFHGMHIISHNGGTPGFSSSWIYVVEKNTSIIILMNRQDYAAIDQFAWEVLSNFESSLTYPQKDRSGVKERKITKKVLAVLLAVESNESYPKGLSKPLEHFLKSESGKGFWKWYFERGFPVHARCVDVEQIDKAKLYRFLLPYSKETVYQLSVLVNEKGELSQLRWW